MMHLGAILWKEWIEHPTTSHTIIGYWAEDDSSFEISCPDQLVSQIICLQNQCSKLYQKYNKCTDELNNLKRQMRVFGHER